MKKVENLDKILSIIQSPELSKSRNEFIVRYSLKEDQIYPCFNKNFKTWLLGEIDIKGFIDLVIKSDLSFNIDEFSIFDLINDYLKIHLTAISDLIDENVDDILSVVLKLKEDYESSNLNIGSKKESSDLSDDVYNPFDEPELIVDEIINVLSIKFANKEYRDRFYDVCIKFIKNIRNRFQTFDILVKERKLNGVGLEENIVDEVLSKIEKIKKQGEDSLLEYHKNNFDSAGNVINKSSDNINIKDTVSDMDIGEEDKRENSRLQTNIEKNISVGNSSIIDNNQKKELLDKEYQEGDMRFHYFDGSIEEMYLNQIKNKEEIVDMNIASDFSRKYANSKLVGPIEELVFFTIKDFRNLDQDVTKRAAKIEQKITVLSSYSARKRVLGIKAWLSSEVCVVYKKMIDESVKYGGIGRVINMRREAGDLYLTSEEIDAIAQLNRKLRI